MVIWEREKPQNDIRPQIPAYERYKIFGII